jgi:hypothetical protein
MAFFRDPKRFLTILITGVAGLVVLIDFVSTTTQIGVLAGALVEWTATLTALALLIGLVSVAASHFGRVLRRDLDWGYSVLLLLAMLSVIGVGIFYPVTQNGQLQLPGSLAEEPIRFFFRIIFEPLASSFLALLVFFSLSAALRALQRRTVEALVIVGVAVIVLVAQLPPVAALPFIGATVQFFNDYVALAGARGLLIGAAIGAIVASVRVLLGFDLPYIDH